MERTLMSPIMLSNVTNQNRVEYLRMLKETETERLFIAVDRHHLFSDNRKEMLSILENHIRFFQAEDVEVGIWIQAFGFGGPLNSKAQERTNGMMKIKSILGKEVGDAFCPEDDAFTEMYCQYVKELAKLSPSLIMLDDDMCLSVRPGIGCFCDRHIKLLEARVGRKISTANLLPDMFVGAGNELRNAWLDVMGDSLRKFCKKVRESIDTVDKSIRVGFCAGYTSWDVEGADAKELSYILAGDTKPFLRFTGAPYWVAKSINRMSGWRLHAVIEFARQQEAWCRNSGIECFTEGDSYPRARYQVPANLIECFDVATIASGNMGALKYSFDYVSSVTYETGYVRAHKKNRRLYEFLDEHIKEKKAIGVKVYEKMRKVADTVFPEDIDQNGIMKTNSLPVASAFLTYNSIPVHYEEKGECAIAFGNNVDAIDKLPKKLILDLSAALRLQEKGVDVGIRSAKKIEGQIAPHMEIFLGNADETDNRDVVQDGENERVSLAHATGKYYDCVVGEKAEVLSYLEYDESKIIGSYIYNSEETEFLIYTFDAYSIEQWSSIFTNYARQGQLLKFYKDFPVIRKCPYLYELCKRGEVVRADGQKEEQTILFVANIFEDEIWDLAIELDRTYKNAECCGAEVMLDGNRLHITGTVGAYGMFAVCLTE